MAATAPTPSRLANLLDQLRDPLRIRIAATATMLLVAYGGVYLPIDKRIQESSIQLQKHRKRQELAHNVEQLRAEVDAFENRVPQRADVNEWIEFVLGGLRGHPIKLVTLEPDSPPSLGAYRAVMLRMQLEGSFADLDMFLRWLESNERLIRVDEVQLSLVRGQQDVLVMQLTMIGVSS